MTRFATSARHFAALILFAALAVAGTALADQSGRSDGGAGPSAVNSFYDLKTNTLGGSRIKESRLGTVPRAKRASTLSGLTARRLLQRCPTGTTPVSAVARWTLLASGQIHFRADAQATSGQIAAGEKWEAVTCAQSISRRRHPQESFWMMKLRPSSR